MILALLSKAMSMESMVCIALSCQTPRPGSRCPSTGWHLWRAWLTPTTQHCSKSKYDKSVADAVASEEDEDYCIASRTPLVGRTPVEGLVSVIGRRHSRTRIQALLSEVTSVESMVCIATLSDSRTRIQKPHHWVASVESLVGQTRRNALGPGYRRTEPSALSCATKYPPSPGR
jgi:hypothetical protein